MNVVGVCVCVCVVSEMSLWPSVLCSLRSAWLPSLYEPLAQSDRNKKPYSELGIGKTAFLKKKKQQDDRNCDDRRKRLQTKTTSG